LATAGEGGDHSTNSVSGELSLKEAAEQMGVSRTSAADARAIFKAEPKIYQDVKDGKISLNRAFGLAGLKTRGGGGSMPSSITSLVFCPLKARQ
jgi:hypothetical protein